MNPTGLRCLVLSLLLGLCCATECFQCDGTYDSSPCGINFNNQLNVDSNNTVSCDNGSCIATTTSFKRVTRGCLQDNSVRNGCSYQVQDGTEVFVCNKICDDDYCNGANFIPARKCFNCDGSYDTPQCGLNFNNDLMKSGNDSVIECAGKCLATTTDTLSRVIRGCVTDNSTRPGCSYHTPPAGGSQVFTCNHVCASDYCNGAGVIPSTKCFSCEGPYNAAWCGVGFNDSVMLRNRSTIECREDCMATTIGLQWVRRTCRPAGNTQSGCFNETQGASTVTVCNYTCNADYCNGAAMLIASMATTPLTEPSSSLNTNLPLTSLIETLTLLFFLDMFC